MTGDHPRDFIGYGGRPPAFAWPGGARLAINFVLNYEEGGERSILDGDASSENRLTDLLLPAPRQGERDLLAESAYEYGSRVGLWRLLSLFAERQLPLTVYAVGLALERNPRAAEAMAGLGCDFVDHGWRWIDYGSVPPDVEAEHMGRSIEALRRLTGERPLGWYLGLPGHHSRALRVREGGFLYDSDAYNDDLPYWLQVGGRPHLIVPHTLDTNDTRLARGLGWGQAGDFTATLLDEFEALWAEGATAPKMMTVALHCRLVGKAARAAAFARFLDHVLAKPGVWICRRLDLVRHWIAQVPPPTLPERTP